MTDTTLTNTGFYSESPRSGILGWLLSTDHKRIGIMYLCCITTMFIVGACLGIAIRLQLIAPGSTIMGAQTYNATFTVHGIIMIFLFIIPSVPAAFGNLVLPIQIGARDVSFPRSTCCHGTVMWLAQFSLSWPSFPEAEPRIPAGPFMCHSVLRPAPTSVWPPWPPSCSACHPS